MRLRYASWLLSGVVAVSSANLMGCAVHGGYVYEAEESPPPEREEVVEARPGYVWVRGNWFWTDGHWDWRRGHYEAERRGYVWHQGAWERRGNRYHWVDGRWEEGNRPNVIIRDHRQEPQPYQPPPGTVVVPSHTNP